MSRGAAERELLLDEDDECILDTGRRGPQGDVVSDPNHPIVRAHRQVDGVFEIMQDNLGKLLAREERLGTLEGRSEVLGSQAEAFRLSAASLHRQAWWQDTKAKLFLAGLATVAFLIVLGAIIHKTAS